MIIGRTKQLLVNASITLGVICLIGFVSMMKVDGVGSPVSQDLILQSPSNDLSEFDRFVVKQLSDTQGANSELFVGEFGAGDFFHGEDVLIDISEPGRTRVHGIVLGDGPTANRLYYSDLANASELVDAISSVSFGINMTRYNEIFLNKEFLSVLITFTSGFELELVDLIAVDQLEPPFDTAIGALAGDGEYGDPETDSATIGGMVALLSDNIGYLSPEHDDGGTVIVGEVFLEGLCHLTDLSVDVYETGFVVKNLTDTLVGGTGDVVKPIFANPSSFIGSDFGAGLTIGVDNNDNTGTNHVYGFTLGTGSTANHMIFYEEADSSILASGVNSISVGKNITEYNSVFTNKEFISFFLDFGDNKFYLYDLIATEVDGTDYEAIIGGLGFTILDGDFGPPLSAFESGSLTVYSTLISMLSDNILYSGEADIDIAGDGETFILGEVFNQGYCHLGSDTFVDGGIIVKNLTDTQGDKEDEFVNPSSFSSANFGALESVYVDLSTEDDMSIYGLTIGTGSTANTLYVNGASSIETLAESIAHMSFGKNITQYNQVFTSKEFLSLEITHTNGKTVELVDLIALDRFVADGVTLAMYLHAHSIPVGNGEYGSSFENTIDNAAIILALLGFLEDNIVFVPSIQGGGDSEVILGVVFEFIVTTPDAFSFAPVTNAALNTLVESNVVTIEGINTTTSVAVSEGSEIRVNEGTWSNDPLTAEEGDSLQVRTTSSSTNNTTIEATVSVGGFDTTFAVTTRPHSGGGGGGGGGGGFIPPATTTDTDDTTDADDTDADTSVTTETGDVVTTTDTDITPTDTAKELIDQISQQQENADADAEYPGGIDGETYWAHQFAFNLGITTIADPAQANLGGALTRAHMAKMFVEFAGGVLGRTADTTKVCVYSDMDDQDDEMQMFARLACQMGIMGVAPDGSPLETFDPNTIVTRAQSATVLSRVLWGSTHDGSTPWYAGHLSALSAAGYITNTNPMLTEQRGFFMIMLQRVAGQLVASSL